MTYKTTPQPPPLVLLATVRHHLVELADSLTDNADHFTCTEAEHVRQLFVLVGMDREVDYFMTAHARGDEEGDSHEYAPDADGRPGWAYRADEDDEDDDEVRYPAWMEADPTTGEVPE